MTLAHIAPTTALVPTPAVGPVTLRDELAIWQDAFEFAKAIAPTDFVPKGLRNNPPAVMACIIKGHELGVSALHALSQIHIIEGRPCVAAELQRALIQAKGHELWTEDFTITRVTLCGRRHDREHVQPVTWTIDDAKRANLAGKPTWRNYPRAMLLARATGELGRLMFADVLAGLGVNLEELTDGVEGPDLDPTPDQPAAKRATRTRRTKSAAATAPPPGQAAQGPSALPPEPGGPPPPLPGEAGYDDEAPVPSETPPPSAPTDTAPKAGERHSGPDPGESEPAAVVTGRAQSIAIQAGKAKVDHHHVVMAITHGAKSSAKDLTAAEGDAVLHALHDIRTGKLVLFGPDEDGNWTLVEDKQAKVDEYQARVRALRDQKAALDAHQPTLDEQGDET